MATNVEMPDKPRLGSPRIGMRLWLTGAFTAVSLITAAAVYLFGDNVQALVGAVMLWVLAGFLIALAIYQHVVCLERAACEIAGSFLHYPTDVLGPATC